tara:strand:+ start:944 stop:2020 length:1077 start_codon:yes stop_codon:yes gene_type:complete
MAEETTSLVDAVESAENVDTQASTENTQENTEKPFDINAFMGNDVVKEMKGNYDEEQAEELDKKEEAESKDSEDSKDSSKEATDEDGFAWGDIEVKKEETPEEPVDEDWDDMFAKTSTNEENEAPAEPGEIDWSKVAKALGKEASSKEEFEALFNTPFTPKAPETEATIAVQEFLQMSDRQLVTEEMKTDGMSDDDIMEVIDKMEDTGTLKREAFRIRKQLNQFLEQQRIKALNDAANADKTRKERVEGNKKELQSTLKGMKEFMGGRVTKKDLQEVYKYIVSGNMAEDVWKSHGNAAEIAMFMLYKDKFAKILRSQGREEGKAGILDSISSPELRTGTKSTYKPKSSGFDPAAFMKE